MLAQHCYVAPMVKTSEHKSSTNNSTSIAVKLNPEDPKVKEQSLKVYTKAKR